MPPLALLTLTTVASPKLIAQVWDPLEHPTVWAEGDLCEYEPWKLVFHEEFNEPALDADIWQTYFPYCASGDACLDSRTHGVHEYQIYEDDNVTLENGKLKLHAFQEDASWYGYDSHYTSGMIHSRGDHVFNRGRFEMRCKVPLSQSHYLWPAFWLMGGGSYCSEIDILEILWDTSDQYHTAIHRYTENCDGNISSNGDTYDLGELSDAFHIYSVDWDRWNLFFSVDGVVRRTVSRLLAAGLFPVPPCTDLAPGTYTQRQAFPAEDDYLPIIVNLALHRYALNPYGVDPVIPNLPCAMEVDWIRVWQRTPQTGLSDLCATQPPMLTATAEAFCTAGQTIDFILTGVHGDVTWGAVTSPLEVLQSDQHHCLVRCNAIWPGNTQEIQAYDLGNPCQAGLVLSKRVCIGPPVVEVSDNLVEQCESFWCIEPMVRGSALPDQYEILVDGVPQTDTYLPYVPVEQSGGYFMDGSECFAVYGASCQHLWAPWPHPSQPFCLFAPELGDYCHEIVISAQNACGQSSATSIVRDRCAIGPCDILDPELAEKLAPHIHVTPIPAGSEVRIVFDDEVDISLIERIEVRDMMFTEKFAVDDPVSKEYATDSQSWPPGVYYVLTITKGQHVITKVEVK